MHAKYSTSEVVVVMEEEVVVVVVEEEFDSQLIAKYCFSRREISQFLLSSVASWIVWLLLYACVHVHACMHARARTLVFSILINLLLPYHASMHTCIKPHQEVEQVEEEATGEK